MTFVDLDRVSLRYGEDADGTLALHGATLQVSDGEFVAVVGPSGCGKSTLMKVITGLWPATAGAVIVSGRVVTGPLSIAGMGGLSGEGARSPRAGWVERIRGSFAIAAFRRHAAARVALPGADP